MLRIFFVCTRKKNLLFNTTDFVLFFHSTSICFLFVPVLWNISRIDNTQKQKKYLVILIVFFVLFIPSYYYVISLLGDFSIITDTYVDRYGANSEYIISKTSSGTGLGKIFLFVYPIAFVVWGILKKCLDSKILYFLLVLSIISSFIQTLSYQVEFVDRIGFYFSFVLYVFLTMLFTSSEINGLIKVMMFAIYIFNWINMYVIGGGGDIYPYKSKKLEITE